MSLPPTLERNLRREKDEIDASISHFHQVVHRLQEERIGRQNERMEVLISKFTELTLDFNAKESFFLILIFFLLFLIFFLVF